MVINYLTIRRLLWFFKYNSFPDLAGLQVCFEDIDYLNEDHYFVAAFLIRETLIKREAAICHIEYLEVCKLPENIKEILHLMLSEIEENIT